MTTSLNPLFYNTLKNRGDNINLISNLIKSNKNIINQSFEITIDNNKIIHSPLTYAIYKKYSNIALYLIEKGADINFKTIPDENTPLHLACKYGLEEVVKKLLSFPELNINCLNKNNDTCFNIAIMNNPELYNLINNFLNNKNNNNNDNDINDNNNIENNFDNSKKLTIKKKEKNNYKKINLYKDKELLSDNSSLKDDLFIVRNNNNSNNNNNKFNNEYNINNEINIINNNSTNITNNINFNNNYNININNNDNNIKVFNSKNLDITNTATTIRNKSSNELYNLNKKNLIQNNINKLKKKYSLSNKKVSYLEIPISLNLNDKEINSIISKKILI